MKVNRTTITDVKEFQVNDVISLTLNDGKEAHAIAVKREADGMLFCLVDCLKDELPMNEKNSNRGGYDASDLRVKLNGEILDRFPADLKALMLPFANGDLLRLPTEKEIFGKNPYGKKEDESVEQWQPMKQRHNRIAFQGDNGDLEWYWLQNKMRNSASNFAVVVTNGNAYANGAGNSLGVRPAFKIRNL